MAANVKNRASWDIEVPMYCPSNENPETRHSLHVKGKLNLVQLAKPNFSLEFHL